jgi:thiosulfate reductase cytochrome b subunit
MAAVSVAALVFTGVEILMVHPRLYWGEAGNDLTPPLLELPISRNYRHGGWTASTPLLDGPGAPVSAGRTFHIFNENGWGRSLHFLSAWGLVGTGLVYVLIGVAGGHFHRHFIGGAKYGTLQRASYAIVVFVVAPVLVLTGLTMSPAVAAAAPMLLDLFGGHQSARTLHFFAFAALTLFTTAHLVMVIRSGFARQIRAMTVGDRS